MSSSFDAPDVPSHVLTERTHLRLPTKPHWIEATVEWLRQKAVLAGACHELRAGQLLVALHEAISNAIVHGNLELSSELKERGDDSFARALAERSADPLLSGRAVDVTIECDASQCRWIITDEGNGFDVNAVLLRHQSDDPEVLLSSGRGILIMKSFLDEVRWELGGRRLILGLRRASGEEKRREQRQTRQLPIRIAPIRDDGSIDWPRAYDAMSCSTSANGISLLQQGLAPSERILIGMTLNDQTVYVPAEVRHCRVVAGDMVELGCRFQNPTESTLPALSESNDAMASLQRAVGELLKRHAAPRTPEDERRSHRRERYAECIDIRPLSESETIAGYARDLSKSGISFIVQAPLPQDIVIELRPRDGEPPLRVLCRVVRCQKIIDGFYDVGAQFVQLTKS